MPPFPLFSLLLLSNLWERLVYVTFYENLFTLYTTYHIPPVPSTIDSNSRSDDKSNQLITLLLFFPDYSSTILRYLYSLLLLTQVR